MKCPKCGKQLQIIQTLEGKRYGHTYTLVQAISSTFKLCDYSIEPNGDDDE